jgi:hypothetical protein
MGPKPVGVRVRQRLGDGVQTQQLQGLHRPIPHRRNPQAAEFAIRFSDIDTTQRLRPIAPLPERADGRGFLFRGLPGDSVDTGGPFPLVLRHSSHR